MKLKSVLTGAAAALTLLAAGGANAANLLVNGGFEGTGEQMQEGWGGWTFYAGGPGFQGWTVDSGSVDITATGSTWGPASEGVNSLDINGWSAGTLSQTFATVAGRKYTVSFDYSRNAAGAPDPATATVSVGSTVLNVVAPYDPSSFGGPFAMSWKTGGFSFIGQGPSSTIRLAATVPGNGGVFFDNVSVTGAVPEPATWATMIGGFGLAGAALRRRRALVGA